MHQILKLDKVKSITCLSTATIYRLIKCGKFPKQVKLSERAAGWLEQDIDTYIGLCKDGGSKTHNTFDHTGETKGGL